MSCFVCKDDSAQPSEQAFNTVYNCKQCGIFILPHGDAPRFKENFRSIISGYVREHQDEVLFLGGMKVRPARKTWLDASQRVENLCLQKVACMKRYNPLNLLNIVIYFRWISDKL